MSRFRAARALARAPRGLLVRAAAAALALSAGAVAADFEAGADALERGDYAAAREAWTAAAAAGDGRAQFELATMLANAVGVERDVVSAYAWFALADANGVSGARERFELLLRDHIPRHCHYDAMKLVRDFERGQPERLTSGGRQNSRCWRIRQR